MLQRFLLVWLLLCSGAAYFWTACFPGSFDPFGEQNKPFLKYLIAAAMFAIGSLLPRDEIEQVVRRWPAVLAGTALQYTSMPLLAFAAAHFFDLQRDLLTGVILVGCVPGAMASNVLTLAAGGNVSYSVSLTTSATLLSPLAVPAALQFTLGATGSIQPVEVAFDLLWQVVGPVVAGHLLSRRSIGFSRVMQALGPVLAHGTILWIIAAVVGLNRERLALASLPLLQALLAVNIGGYAAGYLGGGLLRLSSPMRRALTLEIGMQNAGLGTVLAVGLFPEHPAVTIPTAAYTFGCMLTGTILAQAWGLRRARATEPTATQRA